MVNYRRKRVPGGTYFFTITLKDRLSTLLVDEVDTLRSVMRATREQYPFHVDAICVLPDHLHLMLTLPEGDENFSRRIQSMKSRFTRALNKPAHSRPDGDREYSHWQKRFWEHTIRDESDYRAHADYIHFNPVKHGHAKRVADWPHSSFHRFVREGIYPVDWGGGEIEGRFGE